MQQEINLSSSPNEELVASAIQFMRSITDSYGVEEGHRIWDAMCMHIDPELKNSILLALLTGNFEGSVTIFGHCPDANRVSMIKAIRSVDNRRLGLKEAKDACDALTNNRTPIKIKHSPHLRISVIKELRSAGFYV